MKTLLFLMITISLIFGCTDIDSSTVEDFISGTYVSSFHDSITATAHVIGNDTLVISKQTQSGSETYQIVRTAKFKRMLDSIAQPEESDTDTWTAFYNKEQKVLTTQDGVVLSFDIEKRLALMGARTFQKIK